MKRIVQTIITLAIICTSIPAFAIDAPELTVLTAELQVSVSWTSVSGATGYTLYYAPAPYVGEDTIGNFNMGTNTSASYTLLDGASYYVAIKANGESSESDYSNIEQFTIENSITCTEEYSPVCGVDGKTYSNTCYAGVAGAQIVYHGECIECNSSNLDSCLTGSECSAAGGNWKDNKCDEVSGDGSGDNLTPTWLNQMIDEFESDPVTNPPRRVTQYLYNESIVFHISSPCCDQFNYLYNITGDIICAPDGGITGNGDGQCTDFKVLNSSASVLWEDTRKR